MTRYKQSQSQWPVINKVKVSALWLSDCRLPRYPGIDDGFPRTPPPPAATGVDQVIAAFWGTCAERHTVGNSLELSHPPLGSPLSQSSWYNTRTQGSPSPPSGEFVPSITPLGIPWNWVDFRLEHRCPFLLVYHQEPRTTSAAVLLGISWN